METYTAYYSSPIGWLQLQSVDNGLFAINFIDEAGPFTNNFNPVLEKTYLQLEEYFGGNRKVFELTTFLKGTEFQIKVWNFLAGIPYGKTISYLDLAKQYGDVKAIRAVAAANGRNNLPIIIPCHRVIGSNAKLTGYSGGLWRKQWLLQHEAKYYSGVQQLF